MEPRGLSFLAVIFIALSIFLSSSFALSHPREPFKALFGEENLGSWKDELLSAAAEAPGPANDVKSLILAGNRTKRPDILAGFHKYRGGWDIANRHYWAGKMHDDVWQTGKHHIQNQTDSYFCTTLELHASNTEIKDLGPFVTYPDTLQKLVGTCMANHLTGSQNLLNKKAVVAMVI